MKAHGGRPLGSLYTEKEIENEKGAETLRCIILSNYFIRNEMRHGGLDEMVFCPHVFLWVDQLHTHLLTTKSTETVASPPSIVSLSKERVLFIRGRT